MAITYRGLRSAGSTALTITLNKPTGVVDGDILFCIVYPNVGTVTDHAAWNFLCESGGFQKQRLYWRIASSEPASYTWTFSNSGTIHSVVEFAYYGNFDTSDLIDIFSNTTYTVNDNSIVAGSMNVSSVNSPLLFIAISPVSRTITKPTIPTNTWTEDYQASISNGQLQLCSMIWASSGATSDMIATFSGATNRIKQAFAIAFNPVVASSALKTINGLAYASVKTRNGLAMSSIKSINGLI